VKFKTPHPRALWEADTMAEHIDRGQIKREANALLRDAQVSPRRFYALYLGLTALLELADYCFGGSFVTIEGAAETAALRVHPLAVFVGIIASLTALVLGAGCRLYCMAVRRGERAEYLTLFDGFSFAGRLILLALTELLFVTLWSIPTGMILGVLLTGYGQEVVLASLVMVPLALPPLVAWYRYRFAVWNLCEDPSLGPMEAIALSKRQTMGYKRQVVVLDLSFLGWMALSMLPQLYLYTVEYMAVMGVSMPVPPEGLSVALQLIVPIAAGCLYLPRYQTMELAYFETAKRTSGVTAENRIRRPGGDGPDDMGGYF